MADEIRIALQGHHEQMEQNTSLGWFGTFSGSDGSISVKAVDAEGEEYFFEVDHTGKFGKSTGVSYSWTGHSSWQCIRDGTMIRILKHYLPWTRHGSMEIVP